MLPVKKPRPAWQQLAAQMVHFFALMLWVAGILAILAGMPQLGLAMFVVILLNGTFAFVQEYRAERAGERLSDLLPRRATVIRDGSRVEIDAAELVKDDVVLLRGGDRISADVRLLETFSLSLDASTLTGESLPLTAQAGDMAYAGTFVVEGQGLGRVIATGNATRLASVAKLAQAGRRPRTPLAEELDRVVRIISIAALATGAVFLVIAALVGIGLTDAFLFAIGVVVALVPEGLLPTVTLSLALGAQRMAEHNALVRRLEAVETLGSTTFICTDKTGTLTLNEMSVVEVWTPRGRSEIKARGYNPETSIEVGLEIRPAQWPALREVALSIAYCSNGSTVRQGDRWIAQGDPLEAAVDVFCRRVGIDPEARKTSNSLQFVYPFDPRRRRMSAVAAGKLHVKGAPDAVLPRCVNPHTAELEVQRMASRGLRVIAVAWRTVGEVRPTVRADEIETDLELLGLLGIEDPPRSEVAQSIAECRRAGISVAMVTGDHPATARAIASEVGLLTAEGLVLEGHDLPSNDALLGALVDRDGIVLSRVTPEDKLRIARALRTRGHVVAMTGDGVNDGPALQEASIGVAMGKSGTDVAREAADLVLLDDNFATIVAAVRLGRATFANTRRFLTYHLTDNVAELAPFAIWALSGGRFPLALSVLQVLSLDVGTDILPALALGTEAPSATVLKRPPERGYLLDRSVLVRAFGLLGPVEAVIELAAFLATFTAIGWRPGAAFPTGMAFLPASGAAFTAVVVGQMANAFACRSATRWPGTLGWLTNRFLVYAVAVELTLLLACLYFAPLARILGHAPPTITGAIFAMSAFPAVIVADLLYKRVRRRRSS